MKEYIFQCLLYCAVAVLGIIIATSACSIIKIDGIVGLMIRLCISVGVEVVCFYIFMRKKKEFEYVKGLIGKVLKRRTT